MKGKLGRFIWRKIGGRIIPIRISNVADTAANASNPLSRYRKITAKTPDNSIAGVLNLEVPKKGKTASVLSVNVEPKFRDKGISKNLFARAKQSLQRIGFKFLRSDDLQHVAQLKIRAKQGIRYRAGGKSKSGSRFFADQFGPYQEQTKRVSLQEALRILKNNPTGRQIKGTTKIFRKKKP